jgi:hypothetical protein
MADTVDGGGRAGDRPTAAEWLFGLALPVTAAAAALYMLAWAGDSRMPVVFWAAVLVGGLVSAGLFLGRLRRRRRAAANDG